MQAKSEQNEQQLIQTLRDLLGSRNVLTGERAMAAYCKGFREGSGPALAVLKPGTLLEQWQVLQACVSAGVNIIMQAANTGLTGGSTPTDGCDRSTVVINTNRIDSIQVLPAFNQFIAFSGATLYSLEQALKPYQRVPHSVIGSSCIGASIVGGVCNNSGGALIERGPAYTELALYAQIDAQGKLHLINHLDIDLGDTPEEILTRLQTRRYPDSAIGISQKQASDQEYAQWVRDTESDTPARYNADPRRLHEASGCAGKLAVFAVRLDSFAENKGEQTFYLGANSTETLELVRRTLLQEATELPVSAEYLHRHIFDIADRYGRATVLLIRAMGANRMQGFSRFKRVLDGVFNRSRWLPRHLPDKMIQWISNRFPSQTPMRLVNWNRRFEHQLILTVKGHAVTQCLALLETIKQNSELDFFVCTEAETKRAYLLRFAAAGAALQYAAVHDDQVEGIVALDVALKRNELNWFETLPASLSNKLCLPLYYGHFFCHVFHQDYVVRKGESLSDVKQELLDLLDQRGAEYPAEHNVGHLYHAKPSLKENYQKLDPTNTFNAGVGQMSKCKHYQDS
ncbi:MAG: D-lactate dehydrogenase [Pseudomonadales bacterium]|nr:D-lactate dehydrogenase [Pseudomonadales bacterium]